MYASKHSAHSDPSVQEQAKVTRQECFFSRRTGNVEGVAEDEERSCEHILRCPLALPRHHLTWDDLDGLDQPSSHLSLPALIRVQQLTRYLTADLLGEISSRVLSEIEAAQGTSLPIMEKSAIT